MQRRAHEPQAPILAPVMTFCLHYALIELKQSVDSLTKMMNLIGHHTCFRNIPTRVANLIWVALVDD
jgi:hypothetical protein